MPPEAKHAIFMISNTSRDGETPANTNRHHQKPAETRRHNETSSREIERQRLATTYQTTTPRNAEVTSKVIAAEQLDRDTEQRPTHSSFYIKDHIYGHKRNTNNRESDRDKQKRTKKTKTSRRQAKAPVAVARDKPERSTKQTTAAVRDRNKQQHTGKQQRQETQQWHLE